MGGKRASGRSNSGGHMYPRISSGGSTKSFLVEPLSKDCKKEMEEFQESSSPRKTSFDIISLLEGQEDISGVPPSPGISTGSNRSGMLLNEGYNGNEARRGIPTSETLPSFWHFVQPETTNHTHNELFHHHKTLPRFRKEQSNFSKHKINTFGNTNTTAIGGSNNPQNKRMTKRRKVKKTAQSAKVDSFKSLERSPERLQRTGAEWLRVLSPPQRTNDDASSACDEDNEEDEEDELIKRYFSGLSSAGSSISWADDAMESEFTSQLSKLWEDIDSVCGGGSRPEKMSDAVYEECLQWRKAFPNVNQRFKRNVKEPSPAESPVLDDDASDAGTVIDDAPFSSLVHSNGYKTTRKEVEDGMNSLQANFRTLNCATPRPNIEKSTEFVSAWLSECQNSYVPDHHRHDPLALIDYNNSTRASSPSLSLKNHHPNSATPFDNYEDDERRGKIRNKLRLVSDVARSSYAHYSRSHAKFVNEPNPENFFTSLALANNEIYSQGPSGESFQNRRISEYDEDGDIDEDGDRDSPTTEIVSFRSNVRVQRPISSRMRDHTITPLSTGYSHLPTLSGIGGRHGTNLNKQTGLASSSKNQRSLGITSSHDTNQRRMGMFEGIDSNTSPTQSAFANRVRSGLGKQGFRYSAAAAGRTPHRPQQQAPWSRHTGEDHLTNESNYVSSLYENYPSGTGSGGLSGNGPPERIGLRSGLRSSINNELRSPTSSLKSGFLHLDRERMGFDGSPGSIPECEGEGHSSYKPAVSWLMNRRMTPNS